MSTNGVLLSDLSSFLTEHGFRNEIDGDGSIALRSVNTLEDAGDGEISFLANPKYRNLLSETNASAVVVTPEESTPNGLTALRCSDPYGAITAAIIRIHGHRNHPQWGIHVSAVIAPSAQLGDDANVGPHVAIAEGAVIGSNATIYPGCYIGDGVTIGDDVTLFPNVVIYDGATLGNRVTLHAGTVIGEDGLGYAPVGGKWLKIPQAGSVVLEDDVELGACCTIDRATLGETRIGEGTKFSNQIVIGHGTKIGAHCMFVAQVGVAGSSKIGDHVTMAGQVGVVGHVQIGDNVRIGAKTGVRSDLEKGKEYLGIPAVESIAFRRQVAVVQKLPQMKKRLRQLEAEVERLRQLVEKNATD